MLTASLPCPFPFGLNQFLSLCKMRVRLQAAPWLIGVIILNSMVTMAEAKETQKLKPFDYQFGPFDSSYYDSFAVIKPATISNDALQVTPDSVENFSLNNRSGRIFFNQTFWLWDREGKGAGNFTVASFNTSFLINVFRVNNSVPGEGVAFLIAPDLILPDGSSGQYLGLTNSSNDGLPSNNLVAVELDTFKQDFDPDDNHIGLNINSIRSNKTVSLSELGIQIAPNGTQFYVVWIQYDGKNKSIEVYMAGQKEMTSPTPPRPSEPVLKADLDLSSLVKQNSYLGFSASTGSHVQLNRVLRWNLTVENLLGENRLVEKIKNWKSIGLVVGVPVGAVCLIGLIGGLSYCWQKKQKARSDPNILLALKSLPGTPREFKFRDLKKATNNFDDKYKLGQGGFGVVYRGLLQKENLDVAVKKLSRDNIKGKDDFLAELTIINRLCHKHLVRLLGWCHKNGMLLLVYDFMPNGSLDNHIFCGPEKTTLNWNLRYKIISGVASALHYLHNEYDQIVVHRNVKASNIMLDSNFNARLGDFGLAKAIENEKTSYAELEGVPGTLGYIAPECFHTGEATRESDVYGFGAVLLEVVCGQRPWTKISDFHLLVDWIWCLHRERRILGAVDERLGNDYVVEEAERLLLLGLACSHPMASERPKIQAILQIISGSTAAPHVPPFKPAFIWPSMPVPSSFNISSSNMISTADITLVSSGWTPQYISKDMAAKSKLPQPPSGKHAHPNYFPLQRIWKSKENLPAWSRIYRRFKLQDLLKATNNFDPARKITEDGSYSLYKGYINDYGKYPIAIKRFESSTNYGRFLNEMELLSSVDHPNIVSPAGYCLDESHQHMIIVYNHMAQGTLQDHLQIANGESPLSWKRRLQICIGAARGLEYLHSSNPLIIHRGIKSKNIHLDKNWGAKILFCSLSKSIPSNQLEYDGDHIITDIAREVKVLSKTKSDVYGFGVVLFEVLCGRKRMDFSIPEEQIRLTQWSRQCIEDGRLDEIIDPPLKGEIAPDCLKAYANLAYNCSNEHSNQTPTVTTVLKRLQLVLLLQECVEADIPFSPSWVRDILPSQMMSESVVEIQDSEIISESELEDLIR